MQLTDLIAALSDIQAYPFEVDRIEVRQTHISVVFLAGQVVYKLKKPVNFGFLDFSTLEKRRHFCKEEVSLNRRLAPEVYIDVVPVTRSAEGRIHFEGEGEVIEWAVKMQRLPDTTSLLSHLERDELTPELVEKLADRIASFHAIAESGPEVAESARFEVVARNARDNFEQSESQVEHTVSRSVFDRLWALTESTLANLKPLIEARAARGVPRDTHGDLHLDHVYYFAERTPNDLIAIDCIEFSRRYRHADPIADAAFLVMDLAFHDRRDLADVFTARYLRASGDVEGAQLFPFYTAYRAMVRAKVEGMEANEEEVPENKRTAAQTRARAHWLMALSELEDPARRPGMVLVAGLPGSGKSTLARDLAERANFVVLRSDVVRKELAGLSADTTARTAPDTGLYTPEWTARTYAECLRRAASLLGDGRRVIVDANFGDESHRRFFLDAATCLALPAVFLWCRVSPEIAKQRIAVRGGDASDATSEIFDRAVSRWQAFSEKTQTKVRDVPADGTPADMLRRAMEVLNESRLSSPRR